MSRIFNSSFILALLIVASLAPVCATELIVGGGVSSAAAIAYTGPGDIVSGATAWYGLRAYNAAYATGSNKGVNVRRASDNTTQDINILSTGALDIASANTFAGTDATCTGTISSTTLTCASASSTPHVGSTLTGAGITQPSYIVSCGTFTGGAGTCTLNASQTVSVGETITMQYGLYVTKAYDQSSHTNDIAQSTAAAQPQLLPTCISTLPCMSAVRASSQELKKNGGMSASPAQPFTQSVVFQFISTNANFGAIIASFDGSTGAESVVDNGLANVWMYAGSQAANVSASVSVNHATQFLYNGVSSVTNIDGAETTTNPSTGANSASMALFGRPDAFAGGFLTGYIGEAGLWPSGFSSGNRTSICKNEQAYYGSGNFGAVC